MIETEINMSETDFLDVTLNLDTFEYRPFRKPGDTPLYIHVQSNHPKTVKEQIPKNDRKENCKTFKL